ncbi:MAG: glycosyltransferase involved in cell wall biosynthesis [Arenicella sp.]|jgi:glycosyltransferase involved in cell wall biosynthesis
MTIKLNMPKSNSPELTREGELPLVSVVIPVYNVERYIEEALDSVLAQTYQNIEVLIVDDASPDKSISIVQVNYSDPRIRIIRQENRGLAGARNTGIRNANGRYLAFLDSDDFWNETKLAQHIELMLQHSHCGVSFCSSAFVDDNSQFLGRFQAPKKKVNYQPKDIFCRNPIGNGSVPVIGIDILQKIGFETTDKTENGVPYTQYFDESLRQSEDVDCWTRIAILTATDFYYIDQPLTNYRLTGDGLSANVEKQFETWMQLLNKLEQYAPDFARQYGAVAKAFQYRYLARRSIFQGQAGNAVKFMWLAFKTKPLALLTEFSRTLETAVAGLLLMWLSQENQKKLVDRFF